MDAHPWHDTVMRKFAKTADVPSDLLPGKLCGLGLRTLGAVLGTTLAAILHTGGIQSTTDDVVTDTGKVFYTTAANHDDGVFLQGRVFLCFTTFFRATRISWLIVGICFPP